MRHRAAPRADPDARDPAPAGGLTRARFIVLGCNIRQPTTTIAWEERRVGGDRTFIGLVASVRIGGGVTNAQPAVSSLGAATD